MIQRNTLGLGKQTKRNTRHEPSLRKTDKRIGTWNIKTLNGKEEEIVEEMDKYRIDLLGISETKKKGKGQKHVKNNYVLRY